MRISREIEGDLRMSTAKYDAVVRDVTPERAEAYLVPPGVENHASFLTELRDGAIACTWFAGAREARPDASIWIARLEPGSTRWEAAVKVSDDVNLSEQNPVLTQLPDGRLWMLYTAQEMGAQDTAVVRQQFSSDGGRTWTASEDFPAPEGTFVRQAVVLLPGGRWLLPVFHCPALPGRVWHGDADYSGVYISDDAGSTWREVVVPDSIGAVHMNIVPLADGSLAAFYRSRWGDRVYRSESHDDGETWSAPLALEIPNGNSSIMARADGGGGDEVVFLVSNPVHGPEGSHLGDRVEEEDAHKRRAPGRPEPLARHSSGASERLPLTIQASRDGGITWREVEVLEDDDTKQREFSYPSIVLQGDHAHVAYSYARRTIKYVRLSLDALRDRAS
jgi:predicted neuraminidase